ncbi:MAG TPA: aminotransferase class I/II-fold pyridoxal phosphate-dependent enzyme [Candidatus Atribacteria bacterium]|nr:aminotransferase class I/II-fold pyridoxal phosphate-dependent enzyme [Candidatus Atribacteria bacterium]
MAKIKIEFSNRLHRLPPYLFGELNEMKLKLRQKGVDIIDFGMGNPDRATPPHIVEKLRQSVLDPRNHRYSASRGIFNLRKAVAYYYEHKYNVSLDPESEIICVIGTKEGISHLSLALLGPGDTALVPNPAFPIHIYSVVLAGANVINLPLGNDEEFIKNLYHITHTLVPKPKVLFINYPNNPTTLTIEIDFFKEIVKFAKKNNIIIIHDFAYADITFDGYKSPSFLQVKGAKDVGIEFFTMSKSYNMPGWRIGFCVGNKDIVEALAKIKGYYDYGIFQPIQISTIIALKGPQHYVEENAMIYQKRRDVLCDGLNRIGWRVQKPKATMFVWAPIPEKYRKMGSIEFAKKLMNEANVAVAPGIGFGELGEGYVRIALVENELRIKQAIRQINRALKLK